MKFSYFWIIVLCITHVMNVELINAESDQERLEIATIGGEISRIENENIIQYEMQLPSGSDDKIVCYKMKHDNAWYDAGDIVCYKAIGTQTYNLPSSYSEDTYYTELCLNNFFLLAQESMVSEPFSKQG